MKYLTSEESERWLSQAGASIDQYRNLHFQGDQPQIMTTIPHRPGPMMALASMLLEWSPSDAESLLWMANWNTEPPEPFALFNAARRGHGESRTPIDVPGHLLDLKADHDREVAAGIIFHIMAFNWEACLTSKNQSGFIYLGDEHLVFSSPHAKQLRLVSEYINRFNLRMIDDVRQAWTV